MAQSKTTGGEGIVYLTRRAYESGEIRLLLRTDAVCAERDTGWQLLQGSETGLELSNPENGLLVSVARALELEPKLTPLLGVSSPCRAAYAYDEKNGGFVPGVSRGHSHRILRQHRTKSVWRLCTPSCKFPVIFHKNAREYIQYSLRFLLHLTKNLTTHLSHNLCAVLPLRIKRFTELPAVLR